VHKPIRMTLSALAVALPLLATACLNPYACRSSDDAQGITFDGDRDVTYSYGPRLHINLQAGDTTTATSAVYDANACGVVSGPKFDSRERPDRFSWHSSNPAVATVDANGMIRGRARGQTSIAISASGADSYSILVDVVPPVAAVVIEPRTATVSVGDTLRFDAYMVDASGEKLSFGYDFPYPVNLVAAADGQYVENWIPGNPFQLLKRFTSAGKYELRAITVVRNVRVDKAAVITVVP
jgi:hypothetical protein